jgi:general secretion pathway protein J
MNKTKKPSQEGFTLLEVLISMTVLVFISFAIFQATTETYRLRESLLVEGDFYNAIRLAVNIIQRDVSLIYSPLPLAPPKPPQNTPPNTNQMEVIMNDDLGRTFQFWSPALHTNGIRPSRFVGGEDKMSFLSVSHMRIYRDSHESEFAKISYEIKKDSNTKDYPDSFVLVKTENPDAFASDDIKETLKRSFELLHGIKKLSFTYYQRDGNTWKPFKSWDSDNVDTKNLIPDIIELKIEVKGSKTLNFEGKYKFKPEIPLDGLNHST